MHCLPVLLTIKYMCSFVQKIWKCGRISVKQNLQAMLVFKHIANWQAMSLYPQTRKNTRTAVGGSGIFLAC